MSAVGYQPGDWTAAVGPGSAVMAQDLPDGVLDRLWVAVRDNSDLAVLLDAVTGNGWLAAPRFVLVHRGADGGRTGVLVRGDALVRAVVDGKERVLTGAGMMTWAEHSVDDVSAVELPGATSHGPWFPLVGGVVLVSALAWTPSAKGAQPAPVPAAVRTPGAERSGTAMSQDAVSDDTLTGDYDHLWAPTAGATDSADARVVESSDAAEDSDHDLMTIGPEELQRLRSAHGRGADAGRSVTGDDGIVSSVPGVGPAGPAPLELRFSSGPVVPASGRVLVGREPTAERVSGRDLPRIVTVPSPASDISRNHLELRAHGGDLVATDLRSTNGTLVRVPGAAELCLTDGQSTPVGAGSVLDLGDGVTISIELAGGGDE